MMSRLKRILLETKISRIWMISVIAISLIMFGLYFSYAMFTVSAEKENAISIVTGNLTASLTITGTDEVTIPDETTSFTIPANSTQTITVTITSNNSIDSKMNFYYIGDLPSGVTIGYVAVDGYNIPPSATGTTLTSKGSAGSSNVYQIKIKNITTSSQNITFGSQMGLSYNDLSLPSNGHVIPEQQNETVADTVLAGNTTYDDGVDTFITVSTIL